MNRPEPGELTEAERRQAKRERKGRQGGGLTNAERRKAKQRRKGRGGRLAEPSEPLVAFVHIPKTAGGTVKGMFFNAYSKPAMRNSGNYFGKGMSDRKLRRGNWQTWVRNGGRVTIGHTPYGLFREYLPADTRYVTFLREPIDRVLSHYYRHIHRPETSPEERHENQAASLEEALMDMREPRLNNLSTRLLCGDPSPVGELPASALDDAKANLRSFTFVGIHERFWESVVLLGRTLDLEVIPSVNRHVSVERPTVDDIPAKQREMIAEHNRLDFELYTFATGLFEDAVAAVKDDEFEADIERARESSAAINESAVRDARNWLDRELPAGTSRPEEALRESAEANDISRAALKRVSRPVVVREHDQDGVRVWTRSE